MDLEVKIYIVLIVLCIIGLVFCFIWAAKHDPKNAGKIYIYDDEDGQEHFNIQFELELDEIKELEQIVFDIIRSQN